MKKMCWMQLQNHLKEPDAAPVLVKQENVLGTPGMFSVVPKHFKKYLYGNRKVI